MEKIEPLAELHVRRYERAEFFNEEKFRLFDYSRDLVVIYIQISFFIRYDCCCLQLYAWRDMKY